ncbi:hypothetical protein ASC94_28835 [Massilia sp. Root418]|nr:hypothetical protein ASC94_28835 [Massilia sp. Root418]
MIDVIDSCAGAAEHSLMNAATDQAYLDAKLESFSTKVLGEVRAIVAEQADRQKSFELRVEGGLKDLREEMGKFTSTQDKRFAEFSASQDKKFEQFSAAQERKFEEFSAAQDRKFEEFSAAQDKKFEEFSVAQDRKFEAFAAAQDKKFDDFTVTMVRKFDEFTATQNKKFDEFTASQRIQFAEANALLQTNTANSFKWMMGSVVAMCAVWIGSVNLIVSRPAATPAPIVIYAQAAPAALAPPAIAVPPAAR